MAQKNWQISAPIKSLTFNKNWDLHHVCILYNKFILTINHSSTPSSNYKDSFKIYVLSTNNAILYITCCHNTFICYDTTKYPPKREKNNGKIWKKMCLQKYCWYIMLHSLCKLKQYMFRYRSHVNTLYNENKWNVVLSTPCQFV